MSDVAEVTLTYTNHEARRVASALRYYISNVDALAEDADRLALIATALESATKPPKPAEPTGLGAVVEDAAGQQWVRITNPNQTPWMRGGSFPRQWRHIDAVKVLSEGVQP
jgi:hypothetical protein